MQETMNAELEKNKNALLTEALKCLATLPSDVKIISGDNGTIETNKYLLTLYNSRLQDVLCVGGNISPMYILAPECSTSSIEDLLNFITGTGSSTVKQCASINSAKELMDTAKMFGFNANHILQLWPGGGGIGNNLAKKKKHDPIVNLTKCYIDGKLTEQKKNTDSSVLMISEDEEDGPIEVSESLKMVVNYIDSSKENINFKMNKSATSNLNFRILESKTLGVVNNLSKIPSSEDNKPLHLRETDQPSVRNDNCPPSSRTKHLIRHPCTFCGKIFSTNVDRLKHEGTHNFIHQKYACDKCEKSFYRPDILKRHKRLHLFKNNKQ